MVVSCFFQSLSLITACVCVNLVSLRGLVGELHPCHAVQSKMLTRVVVCAIALLLCTFVGLGTGQLELCKNFISTLDYDTLTVGNKKMVYFAQEKNFTEAMKACEIIGMRLVTIANEQENHALFQFLHNRVWGVNGKPYDYTYWYMWSSGMGFIE